MQKKRPMAYPLSLQRSESYDVTAARGVGESGGGSATAGSTGRRVGRRSSGGGSSRMMAETKAWYGRSGRSFLQEILSCLLDGSCKGNSIGRAKVFDARRGISAMLLLPPGACAQELRIIFRPLFFARNQSRGSAGASDVRSTSKIVLASLVKTWKLTRVTSSVLSPKNSSNIESV
jgi:hypothetical protein